MVRGFEQDLFIWNEERVTRNEVSKVGLGMRNKVRLGLKGYENRSKFELEDHAKISAHRS